MAKRAIVLLSGGLDSSMVLVQALRDGCEVAALTVIRPSYYGKPISKTDQTRLAGNSVCPPVARALVAANIRSAA